MDNELYHYPFLDNKTNSLKIIFIILGNTTLLCMSFWTLSKRSNVFGIRKLKVSKINCMKAC